MSNLVCVIAQGDSITGSGICYPFQGLSVTSRGDSTAATSQAMADYVVSGVGLFRNMAVSGTRLTTNTDNMTTVATTYSDPIVAARLRAPTSGSGGASRPTRKYILSLLCGQNDSCLRDGTVANFVTDVVAFCAARKAAGFDKVILGTVLPSAGASAMGNTNRLNDNSTITAGGWAAANGIDGIFDLASDSIMGDIANCPDTTWFSDQIHPTSAGHARLATIWRATLDAVIATL